jgi:hypothetical protein
MNDIFENDETSPIFPRLIKNPLTSRISKVNQYSRFTVNPEYSIDIDPRSHLEVSDQKHRYGKKLRIYFQEYVRLRDIEAIQSSSMDDKWDLFENFFAWLDYPVDQPEVSCINLNLTIIWVLWRKKILI